MKLLSLGIIPVAIALVACESMNMPLDGNSSFDPLAPPGSGIRLAENSFGPELSPGQFVNANIPNTAFYKDKPKGSEDADKLLTQGTNMKIVANDANYVKVELDSGEVGWVPSVMVASPSSSPELAPIDGAYQVYPPLPALGQLEPLPVIDPNGLPPAGAIPAIIDPDAPIPPPAPPLTIDPIPDLKPTEPVTPPVDPPKETPKEIPVEEPKAEPEDPAE